MPGAATTDVVIVGAGFAGLSAATVLHDAGVGVTVLEARDRVGGRTESRLNGLGERVDTGGQFVCDEMPLLLDLIRSHGLLLVAPDRSAPMRLWPAPPHGTEGAALEGADALYRGRLMKADPATLSGSAADWVRAATDDTAVQAATLSIIAVANCADPEQIPAAMVADPISRGPQEVDELQYFTPHTLHGLAEALAAPLADRIRLSSPVTAIAWGSDGVTVTHANGTLRARRAVLSISPVQARSITFAPALPANIARAMADFGPMQVIKLLIRYDRPFWRDGGWSGSAGFTDPTGMFVVDASAKGRPMLAGFIGGASCDRLRAMPAQERRALILSRIAAVFGNAALTPRDYLERDWGTDAHSPGGYGVMVTGDDPLAALSTLRNWDGPVCFAVSDLSDRFPAYVEGAIHMGRTVAARVRDSLA
jgi:monoamine oxidase